NSACISYCFNSSREKMTSRCGFQRWSTYDTNALPNEPVPPVTRNEPPVRSTLPLMKVRTIRFVFRGSKFPRYRTSGDSTVARARAWRRNSKMPRGRLRGRDGKIVHQHAHLPTE